MICLGFTFFFFSCFPLREKVLTAVLVMIWPRTQQHSVVKFPLQWCLQPSILLSHIAQSHQADENRPAVHQFWAVLQPLTIAQAAFITLLQLTSFNPSIIFFYSASKPFPAAAVPPVKPEASCKVGCCACLVQDRTEQSVLGCGAVMALSSWIVVGLKHPWGEATTPCMAQICSCFCTLTDREEGEQVWWEVLEPCLCAESLLLLCGHQKL